jgi:hypothetical protein
MKQRNNNEAIESDSRAEDIKDYKNERSKSKIVWGTSRLQTKTYFIR